MFFTIIIIVLTLIALMVLHEFGHFVVAKKFGVKVEEFGIGLPPRIWGKKVGETIYSLNILPFGAFVKITGEDKRINDPRSFSEKALWQRALIVLGGVVSFWVIAIIILTFISGIWGVPTAIPDDLETGFQQARVQILGVASDSPAQTAGIKPGDIIIGIMNNELRIMDIDTVREVQEFVNANTGQEVMIILKRGKKELDVSLMPRSESPKDEGAMGVSLARVADLKTAWHKAPGQAVIITARQTRNIPVMLAEVIKKKIIGEKVVGLQFLGPIGIGQVMGQALGVGVGYFLNFIAMISIWLALFNLFPIPALDGGRLLFLAIEAVRRKPIPQKIEQKITTTFFILLICLMAIITLKDILRLF